MKKKILYVGLDVHADSISVATAEDTRDGEVRIYGKIGADLRTVDALTKKLEASGACLRVCYESGPCGFALARHFQRKGIECMVAATSLIPKGKGDKVKTDRRDARNLVRLYRAGELTAVHIPDAVDEAIRDVCRARTDAVDDKRRAICRLKAFLLRHGHHVKSNVKWSESHKNYLRQKPLPLPAMKVVLEEYINAIETAHQRVIDLEKQMALLLEEWKQAPVVRALMGMRGFRLVSAMIVVSEIGDIHRFAHPRQLMAYLGLVPSEATSAERRRLGSITKAGNSHLRWIINECAQNYRLPPQIGGDLSRRQQNIGADHKEEVLKISWKCQQRLYARGRRMAGRLKMKQKIQIALARELCGFVWAIMKVAQTTPESPKPVAPTPRKPRHRGASESNANTRSVARGAAGASSGDPA